MSYTTDNTDRIASPANRAVLLNGTWKIVKCLGGEKTTKEALSEGNSLIGEEMGFHKGVLAFCGKSWNGVSYKVKRVNSYEYFLHKNGQAQNELGHGSSKTLVVTAYCEDKFLYEFVRVTAESMLILIDDQFYCMEKVSDRFNGTDYTASEIRESTGGLARKAEGGELQSGLLIAVRTPVKTEDGIGDYSYRTYWIHAMNGQFGKVLYAQDIFLPRMNGFWKLNVEKIPGSEGIMDTISASRIPRLTEKAALTSSPTPSAIAENFSKRVETKLRSSVIYIGNDYVCVENTAALSRKGIAAPAYEKTLRTYPVDNLSSMNGIKISDIAGENGTMAMENAISDLLKDMDKSNIGSLSTGMEEESQQQSFAVYRKTGHWFLKGRLNLKAESQPPYTDFNLNLIPPANMVAYDILQVPWTEIKDSIPQAVDAYTSPNGDIAVVLTRSELLLYSISQKKLSGKQQGRIALEEGSSVIMAEWALGEYVQSWERSFVKNNNVFYP
jgi:hypothetical protein